jgi:hypothetical protein
MSPNSTTFSSDPGNAVVSQWAKLGSLLVSAEPCKDSLSIQNNLGPIYCRFDYKEALVAAANLGGRLPTSVEIDLILADAKKPGGILLPCFTQPDDKMLSDAGIQSPNWGNAAAVASYQAQVQRLLNNMMDSVEWCTLHDQKVSGKLTVLGFDGTRPAMNCGKWYCKGLTKPLNDGPPAGRAWLKGWFSGSAYIQAGPSYPQAPGPHDSEGSRDYATLTMIVKDQS